MNNKVIYTHDIAANIVEKFEDVLSANEICVSSPEDDDRPEDDKIGLYGSTYYNLVDEVENILIELINKAREGSTGTYDVVTDVYGGSSYAE